MAEYARNLRNGTLTISDGSATPKTLVVPLDSGTLSWDETPAPAAPVYDRESIVQVTRGKEVLHNVSFDCGFSALTGITGSTTPTVRDVLKKLGVALALGWTGVDNASGSAYCVNLIFALTAPETGGTGETITFGKFFEGGVSGKEGDDYNKLSIKGQCVTIAGVRA